MKSLEFGLVTRFNFKFFQGFLQGFVAKTSGIYFLKILQTTLGIISEKHSSWSW
jgi:hypothetical protein